MSHFIDLTDPVTRVAIKPHARARRLTLRISNKDGQASVTVPIGTGDRAVQYFLEQHRDWLRKHLPDLPEIAPLGFGSHLPLFGEPHLIVPHQTRDTIIKDSVIYVQESAKSLPAKLRALCKTLARDHIVPITQETAQILDREISGYSFRDTSSRWGSCSTTGRLMFSWRLILTPPEVLRYVAIHEACHLVEMNHSKAFWDLVAAQMPDYKSAQSWLRKHGTALHRIPL